MLKSKVDSERLLRKFKTLSLASTCIQKTSKYLYQFYKSSDIIVNVWLQALNSVNTDQARIALFYIANEMLQSKGYGSTYFKQSWRPHLGHSINLIKDSSVNDKIRRILNIWIERKVYDKPFVEDLISRLSAKAIDIPTINDEHCKDIIMNFDPEEAIEKLSELVKVEVETSETIKRLEASIDFDDKQCKETVKKLKDKSHCNQFTNQLDNNINHLFQICTMLEEELKIRQRTFELMKNAEIYYQTQQKETLIVEDAYRRYGNLISRTKEALEEQLEFLMDDGGPLDLDDAPSPGKTPPYLYEENKKDASSLRNSPMSLDEAAAASPSQSMDMSEDDTPVDKPYSPSHEVTCNKISLEKNNPKSTLSSSEALKLLTSVFSQSLTKKPLSDINTKVNLQPDIFRNTLVTSMENKTVNDDNKNSEKGGKSDTVFADAFRLISNLTGLKNIGDRTFKSDSSTTSGSTIPILTSKYKSSEEVDKSNQNQYAFNQPTFSSANIINGINIDNIPRLIYPDIQNTSFPPPIYNQQQPISSNPMFPLFNNTSVPPPPVPPSALFNNPLAFTMTTLNQRVQPKESPGSCTEDEDEGGATPTQDEPALINTSLPVGMFNQNVLPALAAEAAEINKQIQNAMNTVNSNQFSLQNMLSVSKDNQLQQTSQTQWANIAGQYSFNMNQTNMTMPFSMMNQSSSQIQPTFTPVSSNQAPTFGPPRAIRTKRPPTDTAVNQDNVSDVSDSTRSTHTSPPTSQSQSGQETHNTDNPLEDLELLQTNSTNNDPSKPADNDSELINLYGDVEEEIDRNYNLYQQSINVRSSRPPPPIDRYHLYNNPLDQSSSLSVTHGNFQQNSSPIVPQSSSFINRPRMMMMMNNNNINNYPHPYQRNINNNNNNNQFSNNRGGGHLPYFPNRTTNFRPKNNYNMFN